MKQLGYGKGYKYSHSFNDNFVEQEYLPDVTTNQKFYEPQNNPSEKKVKELLQKRWGKKYNY